MSRRRILFVDDDPLLLDGLRNLLRRCRHKWEMEFAVGGRAGLERLEAARFDVVITDMRMPGVDGAAVLAHARRCHPGAVRIVLSGLTELGPTLRALPFAHQLLAKPCDPQVLENVIERACSLRSLVADEELRRAVSAIDKLPSPPRMYGELARALADDGARVSDVSGILERDMAMCAKLLQLANSAFFRARAPVTNVGQAVAHLGFHTVKNLVLTVEAFDATSYPGVEPAFIEELERHALATATLASRLLVEPRAREDAFTAGILHDIGHLILALERPGRPRHARRPGELGGACEEQATPGVTHAEVGAYLLDLWGLPCSVVEAVAHHHAPSRVAQRGFDVLAAVHVADVLTHRAATTAGRDTPPEVAPDYLAALGVEALFPSWTAMAEDVVRRIAA